MHTNAPPLHEKAEPRNKDRQRDGRDALYIRELLSSEIPGHFKESRISEEGWAVNSAGCAHHLHVP